MKRNTRTALTLILFACPATPSVCGPRQPFSLAIAPPKEPLKAGNELRVFVTLTNTSDHTISFARSSNPISEEGSRYKIVVRDAQDRPAPPSAQMRELKGKRTVTLSLHNIAHALQPGESFVDQVTVTQVYDLSQPGTYTITVARPIEPWQNIGKGAVTSNSVTVTVTK